MTLLALLDQIGVAVFAATGALAASRKQLDVVGFLFLAAMTGIGGGTFRDLVLNIPVFWISRPEYLLICAAAALAVYFVAHLMESRYRVLLWLDALGLALFCVMGAAKGYAISASPEVAIVTGMLTATFGGVLRDLLSGEPSVLLRPEIYVSAALAGSAVYVGSAVMGAGEPAAMASGILVAFLVRGGAIAFGWSLPRYKPRPGRSNEEIENLRKHGD